MWGQHWQVFEESPQLEQRSKRKGPGLEQVQVQEVKLTVTAV